MTHKPAKILVLSLTDLGRDPRVYRQLQFLKQTYRVTAAGLGDPGIDGVDYVPLVSRQEHLLTRVWEKTLLRSRRYQAYYWRSPLIKRAYKKLRNHAVQLILANDINSLPLALRLASRWKAPVFLDAHEYTPREFDDQWKFNFFYRDYWDYLCKVHLPQVHRMTTVCAGIAAEYKKNYGVRCEVITNAPHFEDLKPSPTEDGRIRMIHHGAAIPSRRLESMIELMDHLDSRFSLDFMLLPNRPRYMRKLKKRAAKNPRIRFCDPVPMPEISKAINPYDLGLFLLWPKAFNYRFALPNKIFEFIQARLAIATWPSPEMARVVRENRCGWVADDFEIEAMAKQLNELDSDSLAHFKHNAHEAAARECAEHNGAKLLTMVRECLS